MGLLILIGVFLFARDVGRETLATNPSTIAFGIKLIDVKTMITLTNTFIYIIGSDSSATDILVWSVPKLTLYEPNYKEKEIIKKSTDLHAEQIPGPKVHFLYCRTEMSQLKILKKLIQTKTNQKKKHYRI